MNTKFTIKNFRVFDEKGVTIDMKPITILTGCNSSGKSSIVKSMVLLDTYIDSLQKDYDASHRIDLTKHKLDFKKETTISLGGFNRVIHRGTENNTLTFEYTVHSLMLGEDVNVLMVFEPDEKDVFNEGYLKSITIRNVNGDVIYTSSKDTPCSANFNLILENFYRFIIGHYIVDRYERNEAKEDEKVVNDKAWETLKAFYINNYGEKALDDVTMWVNRFGIDYFEKKIWPTSNDGQTPYIDEYLDGCIDMVKTFHENKTLFYYPLLKKIGSFGKDDVEKGFHDLLEDCTLPNTIWKDLLKICADFIDSDNESFGAYFQQKETELMRFVINPRFVPLRRLPSVLLSGFWVLETDNNDHVNFEFINKVLMEISAYLEQSNSTTYAEEEKRNDTIPTMAYPLFEMFKVYIQDAFMDLMTTALPCGISYIPSSLVSIRSLYALDGTDELTKLLKRHVELLRTYKQTAHFIPYTFIDKWIRRFDVGYSIRIESDSENMLGATLRLYKNKEDKKGILLADVGYGISQLFVLLLRIEIAIMEAQIVNKNNNPSDLGRPSDWSLKYDAQPETVSYSFSASNIAIEEPEVHLHPKYQSLLADLFVDAYTNYNVHFIVETHSEYLIRKLQVMVADKESSLSSNDVVLYYVDKEESEMSTNRKIDILEDGRLSEPFGSGFYDEATGLSMYLLKMKMEQI